MGSMDYGRIPECLELISLVLDMIDTVKLPSIRDSTCFEYHERVECQ